MTRSSQLHSFFSKFSDDIFCVVSAQADVEVKHKQFILIALNSHFQPSFRRSGVGSTVGTVLRRLPRALADNRRIFIFNLFATVLRRKALNDDSEWLLAVCQPNTFTHWQDEGVVWWQNR